MPVMHRTLSPKQLEALAYLAGLVFAVCSPHWG
jgi:hypothetical protein